MKTHQATLYLLLVILSSVLLSQSFRQVKVPWKWEFPFDEGNHPGYQTEWWYLTGQLASMDGREFGYQLTFFRSALMPEQPERESVWAVRDLFFGHFVITDIENQRFYFHEKISRKGPGLANSKPGQLDVWIHNWQLSGDSVWTVFAGENGDSLHLTLRPQNPLLLHGQNGLSQKGPKSGQASYYYSRPRIETTGELKIEDTLWQVSGTSWFDHEFTSQPLDQAFLGWDWFGIQLDKQRYLMVYLLRNENGDYSAFSGGTFYDGQKSLKLQYRDIRVQPKHFWRSPDSDAQYPIAWRLTVLPIDLKIDIKARVSDHELQTPKSTRVTYWEGPVVANGMLGSEMVTGKGYIELTGYAESGW